MNENQCGLHNVLPTKSNALYMNDWNKVYEYDGLCYDDINTLYTYSFETTKRYQYRYLIFDRL